MLTLIAVMSVAVLGATTMQLSRAVTRRQQQAADINESFYMAEAGLAEAYVGVRAGRTGAVGTAALPAAFGEGLFWVTATDGGDGRITLDSTGMIGRGRAELSMVVERGESSVASLGVFSDMSLAIPAGSIVDSYDSASAAYVPFELAAEPSEVVGKGNGVPQDEEPVVAEPTNLARIGSNEGIAIAALPGSETVIAADVTPGPDEIVSLDEGVLVIGSVEPAAVSAVLPPIEVGEVTFQPGIEHLSDVPLLLYGDNELEFLHIGAGSEVIIAGPARLVIGMLQASGEGASLHFDTDDGRVDIVVVGELVLEDGASISTSSQDATQVSIQVAGESDVPVVLHADGPFHGVVYAPEREIEIAPAFELFGALVGGQLTFTGSVRLHFDRHVTSAAAEAALPKLISWRILDLALPNGSGLAGDPFAILGVDRTLLPGPAQAHADQWLELVYEDTGGVQQTFAGMESGFDWAWAKKVVKLERDGQQVAGPGQPAKASNEGEGKATTDDGLLAFLAANRTVSQAGIKDALMSASPLAPAVLQAALDRDPQINIGNLVDILVVNSPLSVPQLAAALARVPAIAGPQLTRLMAAQ